MQRTRLGKKFSCMLLLSSGFVLGQVTPLSTTSSHRLWDTKVIEQELQDRRNIFNQHLRKKLTEAILYISKGDLKSASAVLTMIKAKSYGTNPQVNLIDAYLDARLQRQDSAIRTLKNIDANTDELKIQKCTLWLHILTSEKRWQEIQQSMGECLGVLSQYSQDELFYLKTLIQLNTIPVTVQNVVPAPYFYFYAPDYLKIEQWLALLIAENFESVALAHLRLIPDDVLNLGRVRILTAISLWNAGDHEYALNLATQVLDKQDWNYQRLLTAVAISQNNQQIAWDSNREILQHRKDLWSNVGLQLSLAWKLNYIDSFKAEELPLTSLAEKNPQMVPLIASFMFLQKNPEKAVQLLNKYQPQAGSNSASQIAYWSVRQWISLSHQNMGDFMSNASSSCQQEVSFGCWMILSGQDKISMDKNDLFPYDSVGDYFRENL